MYAARAVGTEVVREREGVKEGVREREGVKEGGRERERVEMRERERERVRERGREKEREREFIEREWYEEVRRRDMIRKIQGMFLEIKRIYSDRT